MIYLDNAATTFPKPEEVYQMVDYTQRNLAVNVGRGSYKAANEAMLIVEETKGLLSQLMGMNNSNNVVFTPSATIAANQIILGLEWDKYKNVYITPFEHNAIARPLHLMKEKFGFKIIILPFDSKTQEFNKDEAELLFAKDPPDYIFMNHISNVTGAIVPISLISEMAKEYDAITIIDASQSAGLEDISFSKNNYDFLIFAGHKNLYSAFGVGGFVYKNASKLSPVLAGGTGSDSLNLNMSINTSTGFEVGSSNIIAIASLNASLKWLITTSVANIKARKDDAISILVKGLKELGVELYLPNKHTSVISFNLNGYNAGDVGTILSNEFDIAVRTGYHCAPYVHDLIGSKKYEGTVRVSVSYFNTKEDIKALLDGIRSL